MGRRGPVPKRIAQRHGHISAADRDAVTAVTPVTVPPEMPAPDSTWHPTALAWYRSLGDSAQCKFYEPSDWQAARMVAAEMTRMLTADFPSPTLFKAIWSAMDALLTTEGARRRLKIEVDRAEGSGAVAEGVSDLGSYRNRLAG